MKKYICMTKEGTEQTPTGNDIDNLQVLDWVSAHSKKHALEVLVEANPWIAAEGYCDIIVMELAENNIDIFNINDK